MDRQLIARRLIGIAESLVADVGDIEEVEPVESAPVKTRRTKLPKKPKQGISAGIGVGEELVAVAKSLTAAGPREQYGSALGKISKAWVVFARTYMKSLAAMIEAKSADTDLADLRRERDELADAFAQLDSAVKMNERKFDRLR